MSEAFLFKFGEFRTQVLFESSLESPLGLDEAERPGEVLAVYDRNVHRLYGGGAKNAVVLAAGEAGKSWQGAEKILRGALASGLGRDGVIIGVGGGVICDLAAFSASLYMRGCRLHLVPTSLLAMVDAAIGGKTAINLGGFKNLAGTFYPAEKVLICIPVLATLPERELRAGLGEAVKTALLGDRELFHLLAENRQGVLGRNPVLLEELVRRSIAVKGRIVEEDFRESGTRAVLNLGHTFAHALESVSRFRKHAHGEAVAWGLGRALDLGQRLGLTNRELAREVTELLRLYGFEQDTPPRLSPKVLLAAMRADKKKRRGRLRLVMLREIGDTVVQEVDDEPILQTLQAGMGEL